jgi:type IV pilus biogenesis protein CpaD/CtpE
MERIEVVLSHEDRELIQELRRTLMAFADSITKLTADVATLVAENGPAAVAAAVTAAVATKDAADAAAVDAIDATVVAAITPAAPAAPAA